MHFVCPTLRKKQIQMRSVQWSLHISDNCIVLKYTRDHSVFQSIQKVCRNADLFHIPENSFRLLLFQFPFFFFSFNDMFFSYRSAVMRFLIVDHRFIDPSLCQVINGFRMKRFIPGMQFHLRSYHCRIFLRKKEAEMICLHSSSQSRSSPLERIHFLYQ